MNPRRVNPLPPALCATLALASVWAGPARSAGYSIYEQGSKALGMAGAFTAQANDPSAIFYNPAGLARLEGTQFQGGVHFINIKREFSGAAPYPGYGVEEKSPTVVGTPINLYLSHRAGSRLALGLGVNNPFGLKTDWENPAEFSGRFISQEAGITPFFITPTVACQLDERIRLGAGISYIASSINLQRAVAVVNPFAGQVPGLPGVFDLGTVEVDGSGSGVTWNVGAQVDVADDITIGGIYRSGTDIDYDESDADFTYTFAGTGVPAIDGALAARFPDDQQASVSLPFPASAVLAVAFQPHERWTVEVDGLWTGWSRLQTVGLDFTDESLSSRIPENWHDALSLRVGAEWRKSERLALRAGWYYDESPQPTNAVDPLLPDADRNGVTAGAGFDTGKLHFDVYALALFVSDRSTRGQSLRGYDGNYTSGALIGGLNVNYRF